MSFRIRVGLALITIASCLTAIAPPVSAATLPEGSYHWPSRIIYVDNHLWAIHWPVQAAIDTWNRAGVTTFVLGSCQEGIPCVVIKAKRSLGGALGFTYWHNDGDLLYGNVLINVLWSYRLKSYAIKKCMLMHELGHALGMPHVIDPNNLMYPFMIKPITILSTTDVAYLKFLYADVA